MINLSTPVTHSLAAVAAILLLASCGDTNNDPNTTQGNSYASIDCPRLELESLDDCTHADNFSEPSVDLAERADVERFCQSTCNKSATVFWLGSTGGDYLTPKDLSILEGTIEIGGLHIQENSSLENLDGLESLETVKHSLRILYSPNIDNIHGLKSLRSVGEDLTLQDLDELESLDGLESLEEVFNLGLFYNDRLRSIDALSNLQRIDHGLGVEDNPQLPNCKALQLAEAHGLSSEEYRISNNGTGSCE